MDKQQNWPAWFYGPNGASQVFENEKDVPSGWADHPSKVKGADKPAATTTTPAPKPPVTPAPQAGTATSGKLDVDPNADVDADGRPWSPELHSATKTKTQAGLWRMKVGASRPEPKPGFPKPKLDL
jgi:hypothetical protein